jgi:hypothetical protein
MCALVNASKPLRCAAAIVTGDTKCQSLTVAVGFSIADTHAADADVTTRMHAVRPCRKERV